VSIVDTCTVRVIIYLYILKMYLTQYFYKIFRGSNDRHGSRYCLQWKREREKFTTGTFPRTPSTALIICQKWADGERAQVDLFLFFLRQYKITNRYALLVVISENNWILQYLTDFLAVRTFNNQVPTLQILNLRHNIKMLYWPIKYLVAVWINKNK